MDDLVISEVRRFVEFFGTQQAAADAIGVTNPQINHFLKGRRRVSPDLALAMEKASDGLVSKERLIFGKSARAA